VVSKIATDSVQKQPAKLSPVLSNFYRSELAELRRRSICPDLVFGRLWGEIGCRGVLRRHLADRCYGFDAERAIYLTVTHRELWYPAPIAMPAPRSTAYTYRTNALTLEKCPQRSIRGSDAVSVRGCGGDTERRPSTLMMRSASSDQRRGQRLSRTTRAWQAHAYGNDNPPYN
jgi:hypothetical protein